MRRARLIPAAAAFLSLGVAAASGGEPAPTTADNHSPPGSVSGPAVVRGEPTFKKVDINPKSIFEGAGVFDVDNDGDLDIVSGSTWYEAPDWTPHHVRDVERVGTYMNDFATLPADVNGDGKMDFLTVSYFGKNIGWVENPGDKTSTWAYHPIDEPGPSECAVMVDLNGDGKPEFLPNTVNTVIFYVLEKAGKEPKFKKVSLGDVGAGHGVGTGDVNRDGRLDILTPTGWFEAPADPFHETWTLRQAWKLGATGIQIYAGDFDGDGDTDLVYGMGHDIGLYWLEQIQPEGDQSIWTKHLIDDTLSSVHVLQWVDLDGDGQKNELLSGKRVYAHEVEPGDTGPSIIAYYRFDKPSKTWTRHVISQSEPARNAPADAGQRDAQKDFPAGTAGTGLEITAIDIDKDGDIDLVCPGKSGLYLFLNQGTK
jgi:hypothetical protein